MRYRLECPANRYVFKSRLNCSESTAGSLRQSGSEVQTVGPATEKARVPNWYNWYKSREIDYCESWRNYVGLVIEHQRQKIMHSKTYITSNWSQVHNNNYNNNDAETTISSAWNGLPPNVTSMPSLTVFIRRLKNILFRRKLATITTHMLLKLLFR